MRLIVGGHWRSGAFEQNWGDPPFHRGLLCPGNFLSLTSVLRGKGRGGCLGPWPHLGPPPSL